MKSDKTAPSAPKGSYFRICREPMQFRTDVLRHLGHLMTEGANTGMSMMPAGFTYFAQFIDHDVTYSTRRLEQEAGPRSVVDIINERTPTLDLDSLYGYGFDDPTVALDRRNGKFVLQQTSRGRIPAARGFGDLPRDLSGRRVLSADDRADENLLLSQMTVLWMQLHNKLIDRHQSRLSRRQDGKGPRAIYRAARREATLIYQWIVLYDFLPNLTDRNVYRHYFPTPQNNRPGALLNQVRGERPKIPIEFVVAAFRFGHAVVRSDYQLSHHNLDVRLDELFLMTGRGGFRGERTLPADHVVDWRLFFPFNDRDLNAPDAQPARPFAPVLPSDLGRMPVEEGNLAIRNLLRGNVWAVSSGQHLVEAINVAFSKAAGRGLWEDSFQLEPVPDEVIDSFLDPWLRANELSRRTPLWFYLLCDSAAAGSNKLGPIASAIVIETLLSLIRLSRFSLFHPQNGWSPTDNSSSLKRILARKVAANDQLTMADMIAYAQSI